jgi:CHASE1-domain containing sensor protein/two-component sensor histidine kinase
MVSTLEERTVLQLFGTRLPALTFALTLVLGAVISTLVYHAEKYRHQTEAERLADAVVVQVMTRISQHVTLLRGAKGLFNAQDGEVSRNDLSRYLDGVGIDEDLAGIQGVGFARMIPTADAERAAEEIALSYQSEVEIRPETDQIWRTPIVLLEPADDRNREALGFDMYANPIRRAAMEQAIATGAAAISAPVELVQEITADKQTGFLVYLPFAARIGSTDRDKPDGFVYAPFRAGDLIAAALTPIGDQNYYLRIADSEAPDMPLIDTFDGPVAGNTVVERRAQVFGREWSFAVSETAAPNGVFARFSSTILAALASVALAFATSLAIQSRQNEAANARAAATQALREADHRQLLLQEMHHRIKNHITRIQSIARQSARGVSSVKEFTEGFDSRLRSMAQAQDLLAGKLIPQTDIEAILKREVVETVGDNAAGVTIEGPLVALTESKAHAFALIVHELVTNALKYGGLSSGGRGLTIGWSFVGPQSVSLTWSETLPEHDRIEPSIPGRKPGGFGLKLIDACLRGELDGKMERRMKPNQLVIDIKFSV